MIFYTLDYSFWKCLFSLLVINDLEIYETVDFHCSNSFAWLLIPQVSAIFLRKLLFMYDMLSQRNEMQLWTGKFSVLFFLAELAIEDFVLVGVGFVLVPQVAEVLVVHFGLL